MALQPALSASRNWGGALNRLALGFLGIGLLHLLTGFPPDWSDNEIVSTGFSIVSVAGAVLVTTTSMILGGVFVMVGSIGKAEKFGEAARVRRAARVGRTGNAMLAEILRDANQKFELASGFFGLLYYSFALVIAVLVIAGTPEFPEFGSSKVVDPQTRAQWAVGIGAFTGMITGYLVNKSATNSLNAIDVELDALDKTDEGNASGDQDEEN